jgi:hypothetical protein
MFSLVLNLLFECLNALVFIGAIDCRDMGLLEDMKWHWLLYSTVCGSSKV